MRKITSLLFAAAFMLFCSNAFSQVTVFIKAYDENGVKIDGGSVVPGHAKDIETLSYSFGVSSCGVDCGPNVSDFSTMMILNPATIVLKMMLLKGLHLTKIDMAYRKGAATYDFYNVHMEDVLVSSVQESGSSETPAVSVSFTPGKIAWQYTKENSQGGAGVKTKGGWDVGAKTEWSYY